METNAVTKALVIDDSRAMRSVLTKILVQFGFATVQASQGLEALAVMEREGATVDLILSDWNMPEMNGLEFLLALRAQERFALVPVIMVTTETEVDRMLLALSSGANEYIMKPFTPEMIEEKLRLLGVIRDDAPSDSTPQDSAAFDNAAVDTPVLRTSQEVH